MYDPSQDQELLDVYAAMRGIEPEVDELDTEKLEPVWEELDAGQYPQYLPDERHAFTVTVQVDDDCAPHLDVIADYQGRCERLSALNASLTRDIAALRGMIADINAAAYAGDLQSIINLTDWVKG